VTYERLSQVIGRAAEVVVEGVLGDAPLLRKIDPRQHGATYTESVWLDYLAIDDGHCYALEVKRVSHESDRIERSRLSQVQREHAEEIQGAGGTVLVVVVRAYDGEHQVHAIPWHVLDEAGSVDLEEQWRVRCWEDVT
jgi:hypothetical protein